MIGYLSQNHPLVQAFALTPVRRSPRQAPAFQRVFKLAPKLADCFREGEVTAAKGSLDRPISGLAVDSRRVVPGALFFALPGERLDGASNIDEAVSRGAVAIVSPVLPALPLARVTFLQVADVRATLAAVAQRYYKFPDREMDVVGVTGAQGKTTVAHLLQHLLEGESRVGLIGSIHYDLGTRTVPSHGTTPEPLDIFGLMAQMRDAGCRHAVLEVSSDGLFQQRVQGVQLGAAVFTNLTRDDFAGHGAGAGLRAALFRLFTGGMGPVPRISVVNLDDALGEELAVTLAAEVAGTKVVTFGEHPAAQVRADQVVLDGRQTRFRLVWPGGTREVAAPFPGRYNVSNLLAAIATGWGLGRDPVVMTARLRSCQGVPGRMERIEAGQPFNVLVDSAQTEAALRRALGMLRGLTPGRLFVVFGCAGQRDRTGRPRVTRTVQEFADFAVATADNPRTEPLAQIFDDMRAGVQAAEKIAWIADRRRAIGLALGLAGPGDCVLIAGKGHETCQEWADTVFPFDDRQVARELIAGRLPPRES